MPSTSDDQVPTGVIIPPSTGYLRESEAARVFAAFHLRLVNLETQQTALFMLLKERGVVSDDDVDMIQSEAMKMLDELVKNHGKTD